MNEKIVKEEKMRSNSGKYARIFVCLMAVLYLGGVLCVFGKPETEYSDTERRRLTGMPEFAWEELWSGEYVEELEKYMTDQFPLRDGFRYLKTNFSLNIMQKQDTGNIYVKDGYLCKMEYPMDEDSIYRATLIFENLYEKYLKDTKVSPYIAIVPDKNYFLAGEGVLAMDYEEFFGQIYEKTPHFTPISIAGQLQLTDYYRTDTHWKQEEIIDVADTLAEEMKVPFEGDFEVKNTEIPFYGVYYGQVGLNLPPDDISYCTNEMLENCYVYDYENDKEIVLYDVSNGASRDPYEMFLGGNISLATIENEDALSDKELVVFGDSFSRSLLPLLAGSYQKITLLDIRYLSASQVGKYVAFTDQDVLFLFSTSVINNSVTLKK